MSIQSIRQHLRWLVPGAIVPALEGATNNRGGYYRVRLGP